MPVTIVMPLDAPALKREATEGFGATGDPVAARRRVRAKRSPRRWRARSRRDEGLVLLHPFDDPLIVAGQAGAGLEALEQLAELGARPMSRRARWAVAG